MSEQHETSQIMKMKSGPTWYPTLLIQGLSDTHIHADVGQQ